MISEELQYRIHRGERDAFMTFYSQCAKGVYLRAFTALNDENCAKEAVKRVFSSVYKELRAASGPLDLEARIGKLTDEAVADLRVRGLPAPGAASQPGPEPEEPDVQEPAPERAPDPLPPPPSREVPLKRVKRRKRKRGNGLLTLLIVLLILLILWMVCGILMDLGVLPFMDLGYRWFNEWVYPLFSLGGGAQ